LAAPRLLESYYSIYVVEKEGERGEREGERGREGRGDGELWVDFGSDCSSFDFTLFCDFIAGHVGVYYRVRCTLKFGIDCFACVWHIFILQLSLWHQELVPALF